MMGSVFSLFRQERGVAAIEYALIAGVLSVAVLAGSLALRGELTELYQGVGEQVGEAMGGAEG
jgi:Flp pilus assembly pilin Flp